VEFRDIAAHQLRRDAGRPGWFLLDKILGGRKVKFVKRKTTPKIL
jgi:hypothetical protein